MGGKHIRDNQVSLTGDGFEDTINVGKEYGGGVAKFHFPDGTMDEVRLMGAGAAAKVGVYPAVAAKLRKLGHETSPGRFNVAKSLTATATGIKCCEVTVSAPNVQRKPDAPKQPRVADGDPVKSPAVMGLHAALARQNLNLLLEGVPGSGKTYTFRDICDQQDPPVASGHRYVLNCHPSTQYEDVIEGLRPEAVTYKPSWRSVIEAQTTAETGTAADAKSGKAAVAKTDHGWHVVDGVFLRACTAARDNPGKYVAILLDELNRANVPRMLGDLLTVMERSKRVNFVDGKVAAQPSHTVSLPISGRTFLVPDNLIIVATMNSVDHSVAPLDQALLRRFWRVRVEPMNDKHAIAAVLERKDDSDKRSAKDMWAALSNQMQKAVDAFLALNTTIGADDCLGPDGMIGQSFLFDMKALCAGQDDQTQANAIRNVWRYGVAPQVIASVQAAGKERWFSGSEYDDSNGVALVNALANCYFTLTWKGEGMTRALRMVPFERPAQTDDKVQ